MVPAVVVHEIAAVLPVLKLWTLNTEKTLFTYFRVLDTSQNSELLSPVTYVLTPETPLSD